MRLAQMLWINKPAGLLSQGDRTGDVDVLALSREYVRVATGKPGEAFVAMVHRLDRPGEMANIYVIGPASNGRLKLLYYTVPPSINFWANTVAESCLKTASNRRLLEFFYDPSSRDACMTRVTVARICVGLRL